MRSRRGWRSVRERRRTGVTAHSRIAGGASSSPRATTGLLAPFEEIEQPLLVAEDLLEKLVRLAAAALARRSAAVMAILVVAVIVNTSSTG